MWRYVLKRLGLMLITTFVILSLTFILMKMIPFPHPPGTAETRLPFYMNQVRLGYMYRVQDPTASAEVSLQIGTTIYRFNQFPVLTQYSSWLRGIFTEWNWGLSTRIRLNVSAMEIILDRLPYSLKLNLVSVFIAVPLGFVFGITAALNKNKPADHIISTGVMIFISIPSFVMITFLLIIFAYGLKWLPTQWPSDNAPLDVRVLGFVLPVASLAFGSIAGFARYTRAELAEIMSSEFLLLARTKGLTKTQSVIRHALRNSLVPIIPMIIGEFVGLLAGSMILENLYGIPGIGSLFITAIQQKDYNVVMVDMAMYTMIGLLATLLVDLSYGIVDPRIRMGAKK
ncbi:MAG TPA: ABC transporter permease [Bacilli bacterium]|nr:ABC transporter permease [Bacilli bacterium]